MGIFIGAYPCAIVPFFDEIFGTECTSQTYGILIEFLSQLSTEKRTEIVHYLYDDMCHLKVIYFSYCLGLNSLILAL